MNLQPTKLDLSVSSYLADKEVLTPLDYLDEKLLCSTFNIQLYDYEGASGIVHSEKNTSILLDSSLSGINRREKLIHIITQILLLINHPKELYLRTKKLNGQSIVDDVMDAIALPYHILITYDLNDPNIFKVLSKDFILSPEFCRKRVYHLLKNENLSSNCKPIIITANSTVSS